jgi:hypothetical protein
MRDRGRIIQGLIKLAIKLIPGISDGQYVSGPYVFSFSQQTIDVYHTLPWKILLTFT